MGFSYLPNPCFGSDELGLCLGCCEWTWAWREAHRAIGLVDGYLAYLFIPINNVLIESFDYRSTVFGINKYSWFLQNNLGIGIKATLINIEAIKFVCR